MQRVKRATAVAVLPAAPSGGTPGFFSAPDPAHGVPATVPGYEWYNAVQEELLAVIEGQGLSASDTDRTQLRQAIAKMIQAGQRAVILNNCAFAGAVTGTGKAVYWDSGNNRFDLAVADGSAKQSAVGFADVPNGNVYCFGDAVLFAGLTPGARYFLDPATAGAITTSQPTANAIFVGIAKNATELFVDLDAVPQTVISNVGQLKNVIINGGCLVAQRPVANLGTAAAYGQVDRFAAWGAGTAVSAGTITQDTASSIGRTGAALKLSGVTITGAGIVYGRHRIEAAVAKRLKNQIASFSVLALHDVGSSINYTVTIRKANAPDNFSSTTNIQAGAATPVASASGTQLTLANVNMGDCSNGIEIEVSAACGAVATKNFSFTEWQLEESAAVTSFERRDFDFELAKCQRYFCKSYDYGTAPATATRNGMVGGCIDANSGVVTGISTSFPVPMRASPTVVAYDGAGATGKCSNYSTASWTDGLGTTSIPQVSQKSAMFYNYASFSAFHHYTADAEL